MNADTLRLVLEARAQARGVVVITHLPTGTEVVLEGDELRGADPEGRSWPLEAARDALRTDRAGVVQGPSGEEYFLRPHNPPIRVLIVGAAHAAQALVELVQALGFRPVVVDPRQAFATPERFPGVAIMDAWPDEAIPRLAPDHRTAVVTLSHDPKVDDPALLAALATPAFYIAALGSRRTHEKRLLRLAEAGATSSDLARIQGPAGLDIGARSPQEIALSIAAQMVASLRGPL